MTRKRYVFKVLGPQPKNVVEKKYLIYYTSMASAIMANTVKALESGLISLEEARDKIGYFSKKISVLAAGGRRTKKTSRKSRTTK